MTSYIYNGTQTQRSKVMRDETARNPRTWDNLGHVVTFDVANPSPDNVTWLDKLFMNAQVRAGRYSMSGLKPAKIMEVLLRTVRAYTDTQYVVGLVRDSFGALHIAQADYQLGLVGIAFITREDWVAWDDASMSPREVIEQELKDYNTFAAGDVWRVQVQDAVDCPCEGRHYGCSGVVWVDSYDVSEIYTMDSAVVVAQMVMSTPNPMESDSLVS